MTLLTEDPCRSQEITKDVRYRIEEQISHFGGVLPERHAIGWGGYLAALWKKGLLTYSDYDTLANLLPDVIAPDPIKDIFIFEPVLSLTSD